MSTQFTNRQWRLPNNENKDKQSNYSMDFDGSQYIDTNYYLPAGTKPKSISYWFKNTDPNGWSTTGYNYTIHGGALSTGAGFGMGALGSSFGSYLWFIGHSTGDYFIPSSATGVMTTNVWYHIVVTYDNSRANNLHFYLDGVKIDETNETLNTSTANSVKIGASATGGGNSGGRFMEITDVCFFDYALSESQVTTLWGSSSTGIGNPQSITPNPVAWYNLGDQDAFNGADYLVPNSSLKDYVFDFNPNDADYINFINGSTMARGQEISYSVWANLDSFYGDIIGNKNSSNLGTGLNFATGNLIFQLGDGSNDSWNNSRINPSSYVNTGEWFHIIGTFDGTNAKIYINGVERNNWTPTQPFTISGWNNNFQIGKRADRVSFFINGRLSNVAFWNSGLTLSQVTTIYNNGSPADISLLNPVSWWKLNAADTYDSSTGNWAIEDHAGSNDGTSSGMTQANLVQSDLSFTSGYSPYALDFDSASSDRIDTGAKILNNMTSYTASIWAKGWSTSALTTIMSQYDGGSVAPLILTARHSSNTNGFTAWLTLGGTFYTSHNDEGFSDNNKWVNLTVTWDGSDLILYVNGIAGDVTSASGTIDNSTTYNFHIGGYSNVTSSSYDGQLSNCSVWNTALTQAQVSEIYNVGVPSNLNNHSAYSNLVSWWQLGSNSSFNTNWTVLDEKGSNNGTSVNMTEVDIVDGVGSYANGLSSGMGGDEVIGDAPYSSSNSLSVNMDVEDRTTDTPS